MTTCEVCGFTPKNPRKIYYSTMLDQTLCDDMVACKKRQARTAAKEATK